MLRNIASQKWRVYAWDVTTGLPKTGDAANITGRIRIDDGANAATNDVNPTEADATNEPGYYDFDLTQAETNGAKLALAAKSSTADVAVMPCPPVVYTRPQYFSLLGIASDGDLTKVNTLDGHTPQTGDAFARIGVNGAGLTEVVPADGSIDADKFAANAISADALAAAAVAKIEAALLNEGDGQALIDAIVQAIDAADIDTNILPALIRDAILNRVLSGNHETAGSVGKLIQNLDALISTRATPAQVLAQLVAHWDTAFPGTVTVGSPNAALKSTLALVHTIVSSGTHGNAALKSLIDALAGVAAAILEDTGTTGVPVSDKTGFKLAADGLDSIDASQPAGVAANWAEMVVLLYRRFFKKVTHDTNTGEIKTFADDGTTPLTTQSATESGGVETQGAAT